MLGEFFAGGIHGDRQMHVCGLREIEQTLQHDLPCCGVDEIGAPDDLRDALICIVDHHGQLIGMEAIGTTQYEISDLTSDSLGNAAVMFVDERDRPVVRADAPCARGASVRQPVATRARVDRTIHAVER